METILNRTITVREVIFAGAFIICLTPLITPPIALLLGIVIARFIGHPYLHLNHKATHLLLQISVVGLGFGMNITSAIHAGREGFVFTIASITGTLAFGLLFGRMLKITPKTSLLISAGTAICGGSAIAAISPVIKAEEKQISVALGTVFILNSFALFLFPAVGHLLHLSQTQFGLWCAIAIHDTSAVVGAANKYGSEALAIATTVKLARALWIIPVSLVASFVYKNDQRKVKIPLFIGLFIIAMLLHTYVPFVQEYGHYVVNISKAGLTLTLFLIGCGLNAEVLKGVGVRPFLQGIFLWILIAGATLLVLYFR